MLAALGIAALTTTAFAQNGMWSNFPIAGGNAYSCGSVNGVSNCTVPAGPALTGSENMPANTNAASGAAVPQNVLIPVVALGAGAAQFASPLTGTTVAVNAGVTRVMLTPAGTISTLTLTLPPVAGLVDNQLISVGSSQTVTTLTVGGNGASLVGAPTTVGATSGFQLVYRKSNTTWYRIQ